MEGFRVLEGIRDGLRHGCRQFNAALGLVVGNLQVERREHLSLELRRSLPQRLPQVSR